MEKNEKNKRSVEVKKSFSVPVERLFEAWTNPDDLKKWWKPMGKTLKVVENNLTPGGDISYEAGEENENITLVITGKYEEVLEDELLIYSWNLNFPEDNLEESPYRLRVEFSSSNDGSFIKVHQENLKSDESVIVHHEGWERGLEDLYEYLAT